MKLGTPKTDALIKYYDQIKLTKYWSIKQFSKTFDELVRRFLPPSWVNLLESPKKRQIWRKMTMQQLGLTKLNILCQIKPNSLPKESRFSKILRNKMIFSGFSCDFGFYPLTFCSNGNLRDHQAKLSLLGVFDPNHVSKLGLQKMVTDPKKYSSTSWHWSFCNKVGSQLL